MTIHIRKEKPEDICAIEMVTEAAYRKAPHTSHTEQFIVNALREAQALTLSLVAEENGVVIGHVAVSAVSISDGSQGWYGLGPISVMPDRQREGIGTLLMEAALDALRNIEAQGCVLLGSANYYRRFGFKADERLNFPEVPPEYFQMIAFTDHVPCGNVIYHYAFTVKK